MKDVPDKRSVPRALTDFSVELYEEDGQTLSGIAKLTNLSVAGACVESTSHFDAKARLVMRLLMGRRHLLTLPVEVVWIKSLSHKTEYGLQFGAYSESARALIIKFVTEYFRQDGSDQPAPFGY